ncbi:hypothetical protein WICMUC_000842 [Wickerhamomyces mucosus]|uniref:Uncharacterized protein n=1 Tax=Wickerhamomyces mucosus TaxID=1378264 RepID=A0A9P8TI85_9ASCO|nr:hypothetical protein WICMUC_000842 [Wickerhamomyces mucosus]
MSNSLFWTKEILFHSANTLDELFSDKTANLLLGNGERDVGGLDQSIKAFDKALDHLLIQLNDLSVFEIKLKKEAEIREQERIKANDPQEIIRKQQEQQRQNLLKQQEQQLQLQQQRQQELLQTQNNGLNEEPNILDDINDFLNNVPDTNDFGIDVGFNNNMDQLIPDQYNNNLTNFGTDDTNFGGINNISNNNNFLNNSIDNNSINNSNNNINNNINNNNNIINNNVANSNNIGDNNNNNDINFNSNNVGFQNTEEFNFENDNNFLNDIDSMLNL